MAHEAEAVEVSTGTKGGVWKSIAILAAAAGVCRMVMLLALGKHAENYPGAVSRFIGQNIGGAITLLLIGLLFFFIVRLVRRRSGDPFAGVFTGLLFMLMGAYLAYVGELSHISH